MATCSNCGKEVKPGDWVCGFCGAALSSAHEGGEGGGAAAPPDPYGYAPGYEPQPATTGAPTKPGSPGTLRLVLIVAIVAVAGVAVWFFFLHGPSTSGDEFLGSWTGRDGAYPPGPVVISRSGDGLSVTFNGSRTGVKGTLPAHIDGKDLVITAKDVALAGQANADGMKSALNIVGPVRDWSWGFVFDSLDASQVTMSLDRTSPDGDTTSEPFPLVKSTAAAP
jgi:hypothetical protein